MTRQAVRDVDRLATERFGIPGVILMENAGRGAALMIMKLLDYPPGARVSIVCGAGNNGGDGFVIARHLHNEHVEVVTYLTVDPVKLSGDARTNFEIAHRMDLPIHTLSAPEQLSEASRTWARSHVVVDAILGTGFSGRVRPPLDAVIHKINTLTGPKIVAIDLPSGLDCDTGLPDDATVRADLTLTFVAPKVGFSRPEALPHLGRVFVIDIGVPRELVPGK